MPQVSNFSWISVFFFSLILFVLLLMMVFFLNNSNLKSSISSLNTFNFSFFI